MTFPAIANHVDGYAVVTANVEGIASQAADDFYRHSVACSSDKETIVPFPPVNDNPLKRVEGDILASTKDSGLADYIVISKRGAYDGEGIESVAAGDPQGCIHGVRDKVRALAAVDIGERGFGIVRVYLDKRTHGEGVVILPAE